MRILALLNEKVSSPSDMALELEEPIGVVSYHVKQLLALDCIKLVDTQQRRGAVEHYYEATTRAIFDRDWDKLPKEARTALSSGVLSEVWRDVGKALTAGSFDADPGRHLSWTPLRLDEKGWAAVNKKMIDLFQFASEQHIKCQAREERGAQLRESKLVMMHYLAASEDPPEDRRPAQSRQSRVKSVK